jgi:hypothetical protein
MDARTSNLLDLAKALRSNRLEAPYTPIGVQRVSAGANDLPLVLVAVGVLDLGFELADRVAADAALGERLREEGIDYLAKTAQFAFDRIGLSHQSGQDAVFRPLMVEEVMAQDFWLRLQLAVDAAIALLHAAWVPRNIEVEKIPAMGLQVQTLARGVRGDEDA